MAQLPQPLWLWIGVKQGFPKQLAKPNHDPRKLARHAGTTTISMPLNLALGMLDDSPVCLDSQLGSDTPEARGSST